MLFHTNLLSILLPLIAATALPLTRPEPILTSLLSPVGAVLNTLTITKEAPAFLRTTNTSPACQNLNRGALLCCQTLFDGGLPLVVKLSKTVGYELTPDAINGIMCKHSVPGVCQNVELCCQVDSVNVKTIIDVIPLALFCRRAPKS